MGIWCSITHCLGYWRVFKIELYISVTGAESSTENSWMIRLGRSSGTLELGFLDLHIFLNTSYSANLGTCDKSGLESISFIFGGNFSMLIGSYSLLIAAKWSAIMSADCWAVRLSSTCAGSEKTSRLLSLVALLVYAALNVCSFYFQC